MLRFLGLKKEDSFKKSNEGGINYGDKGKQETFTLSDNLELQVVTLPFPTSVQNDNEYVHQSKWPDANKPKHLILVSCNGPKTPAALQKTYDTALLEGNRRKAAVIHFSLVGVDALPPIPGKPTPTPSPKLGLKSRSLSTGNLCLFISKTQTPEDKFKTQNTEVLGYAITNSLDALIKSLNELKPEKKLIVYLHISNESRYSKTIEYLDNKNLSRQQKLTSPRR